MHTAASLQSLTVKDLGKLASSFGISQWRSMRKEDLVREVLKAAKKAERTAESTRTASSSTVGGRAKATTKQSVPESTRSAGTGKVRSVASPTKASAAPKSGKPILAEADPSEPTRVSATAKAKATEPQANSPSLASATEATATRKEAVRRETTRRRSPSVASKADESQLKESRTEEQKVQVGSAMLPLTAEPTAKQVSKKENPQADTARQGSAIGPVEPVVEETAVVIQVEEPAATASTRKTVLKASEVASDGEKPLSPAVSRRIQKVHEERARTKNLATVPDAAAQSGNGSAASSSTIRDRIVLLVRDAYWIQAWWELTRPSIERAKAAMAEHWHTAQPVLRLVQVETGGSTNSSERVVRDILIHGGVKTWYIDVKDSPKSYRVDIGYLGTNERFFCLGRSNSVTTPRPSAGDLIEDDWSDIADNCEKIYALSGGYTEEGRPIEIQELFEERLGRPMGSPVGSRFGIGADRALSRRKEFEFDVDAEMIIYGTTRPNAHVTLAGTPIKLRADGSFSARLSMPDRRQVLPIVAASPDGVERRTVVLAVERNTKVMEPQFREIND